MEKRTVKYDTIILIDDNTDNKVDYSYLGIYEVNEEQTIWVTFDIILINDDGTCFALYEELTDFSNNIKEATIKGIATFNKRYYDE